MSYGRGTGRHHHSTEISRGELWNLVENYIVHKKIKTDPKNYSPLKLKSTAPDKHRNIIEKNVYIFSKQRNCNNKYISIKELPHINEYTSYAFYLKNAILPNLRRTTVSEISRENNPFHPNVHATLKGDNRNALLLADAYGEQTLLVLEQTFDANKTVSSELIEACLRIGSAKAIPLLKKIRQHCSDQQRTQRVDLRNAMTKLEQTTAAVQRLLKTDQGRESLLKDPNERIREAAAVYTPIRTHVVRKNARRF